MLTLSQSRHYQDEEMPVITPKKLWIVNKTDDKIEFFKIFTDDSFVIRRVTLTF